MRYGQRGRCLNEPSSDAFETIPWELYAASACRRLQVREGYAITTMQMRLQPSEGKIHMDMHQVRLYTDHWM